MKHLLLLAFLCLLLLSACSDNSPTPIVSSFDRAAAEMDRDFAVLESQGKQIRQNQIRIESLITIIEKCDTGKCVFRGDVLKTGSFTDADGATFEMQPDGRLILVDIRGGQ